MRGDFRTRAQKVGNSIAIIVPVDLARMMRLQRGDEVIFGVIDSSTIAVRKLPDLFYQEIKPN